MDLKEISWYMKYVPKKIEDYVFDNNDYKLLVTKWINQEYIDGNLLISGLAGTGKTSLTEIIIRSIIKHDYDLKVIKSRSVNQIDELIYWCPIATVQSKKKIVYIEEFDKLSSTAHTALKDSILEKFQDTTSFICNTNFINKLDPAILSRFNYKFNLIGNKEESYNKLVNILTAENIHFNDEILKNFVETNYKKGLRNLITSIQMGSISGILNLDKDLVESSLEDQIVNITISIYGKLYHLNKIELRRAIMIDPINSVIGKEYAELIEITQYNYDLDWDKIFIILEGKISFLPIKMIVSRYIETFNSKKLPNIHYLSFLYESMKSIMEIS